MSVTSFAEGDKFVVRIIKSHHDNPSDQWVNNYEFEATAAGTEGALLTMGDAVTDFEKALHLNVVDFDRMTISTWEADSVPYDPAAFISTPLTGSGATGVVTGAEPLNECLSVARACASGRFGHIFYRGALDAAEVFAPSGIQSLIDDDEIQTRITAALAASSLEDYVGVSPAAPLHMVLISKDGTQVRSVIGLIPAGVSFLPLDHAWFNRTTGP